MRSFQPDDQGAGRHAGWQAQPLVRAPLRVALQNLEPIASWLVTECGQTSQVSIPVLGVSVLPDRCSASIRWGASLWGPVDACAAERVMVTTA